MKNEIIHNVDNVKVATNELLINSVLNRNFKKLFENDMALMPYSASGNHNFYRVMPYVPGKAYSKNDLVWFVDYYLSPHNEKAYYDEYSRLSSVAAFREVELEQKDLSELKEKYYTVSLYLLRSLRGNNTSFPKREIINMVPMFDASGWKNENPFGTIYTDYFEEFTAYTLSAQLHNMHETVKKYHKFGQLSSFNQIDEKVLRTDLTNLSPDRTSLLFPKNTYPLESDSTIIEGLAREWDTGYVEYDITFKLGNDGSTYQVYNDDGTLRTVQQLNSNYLSLKNPDAFVSEYYRYDNRKYYYDADDADIFKVESSNSTDTNGIVQTNLNSKINVFTGTIKFPIAFTGTDYCVFTEMAPCVATNGSDILEPNVNRLVYANKSRQSITAILVIPTYNGDNPKILYENRFRCQICGRWK